MGEWQPIDTAPKDRDLWLYVPKEVPAQVVGFWQTDGIDGWWQYREQLVADVASFLDSPSHWQPLPLPPATPASPPDQQEGA